MRLDLRVAGRAGYTIIELLIACVVGVVVLSSAMSLGVATFRSLAGVQLRDGIDRNGRFVGMTLQRDLTETGVLIEAQNDFGTLAVWNDSISILRVAFDTSAFPQYNLTTAGGFARGVNNPLGTSTSLDINTGGVVPRLAAGDLARYQLNTSRRLILITSVVRQGAVYRVTFTSATRLIHHDAGLVGVYPNVAGTNVSAAFVQKLSPVMYWRNGTQLMRAQSLNPDGTWVGQVIADGVQTFDASLIFTDGDEATQANGTDADLTNNYNQIAAIRVRATMTSVATDARVNGRVLLTRPYEWFVAPRNLIYERNRM